jgi:MFS family permease
MTDPDVPQLDAVRRRRLVLASYVVAAALTSTGYIATFQNASVAAPMISGSASTGGLPSSAEVAGTAIAAVVLSGLMAARGRRFGVVTGLAIAVGGCALAFLAIGAWSFPILLLGALVIGAGNAAINLSRYAAADLYPSDRRAGAVGLVVWASTVGAVAGPNLVAPANAAGTAIGLPHFSGAFAMSAAFILLAAVAAASGPRVAGEREPEEGRARARTPLRRVAAGLLARGVARVAILALISGQLVMVLIMTMTPYQLNHAGHDDATIGLVISAHTFGMFALSPVSGRLTERFGAARIIGLAFVTLAGAGLGAAAIPAGAGTLLMLPLFLLGFGWNLSFVAGSSMLASGASFADRARLQGVVDTLVWGTAALAGLAAGPVVQLFGYAALCAAGAGLAVVLATMIAVNGRGLEPASA